MIFANFYLANSKFLAQNAKNIFPNTLPKFQHVSIFPTRKMPILPMAIAIVQYFFGVSQLTRFFCPLSTLRY